MDPFVRSHALNNIPIRKIQDKLSQVELSQESPEIKLLMLTAYNRYAESNIPVEYWDLKMNSDFKGDPRLLARYQSYVENIKNNYIAGSSICFAGGHGLGKQLSLDTELPTPTGFIKLSELKENDKLFDEQGNICNVLKLHPINLSPESYEIEFDDGTKVEACADHLWLTWDRGARVAAQQKCKDTKRNPKIRTTKEIFQTLKTNTKLKITNHSIPCTKPINYPNKNLLIDPYVLGCWLGDGTSRDGTLECADQEILDNIENAGYSINLIKSSVEKSKSCRYRIGDLIINDKIKIGELRYHLKKLNLLKNKQIPNDYLYSSYEQRLALLQGLMDTDGCCLNGGLSEYSTKLPILAEQIHQLINSLGIKSHIHKNESWHYNKKCADRYRITFITKLPVFRLKRKLKNLRLEKSQLCRNTHRYIINIKLIDPKPMRCITVDSPSHLFLITRAFIATHNTMTGTCILKKAAQKGYSTLYTTLSDIVNVLTQAGNEEKFLARRELNTVDFLMIDEFDPRFMPNENAADLYARTLENVFRTRSQNKVPTLMCTNSPNVVESFNGSLRNSIESLVKGYLKIFVVIPGEDFRNKKV